MYRISNWRRSPWFPQGQRRALRSNDAAASLDSMIFTALYTSRDWLDQNQSLFVPRGFPPMCRTCPHDMLGSLLEMHHHMIPLNYHIMVSYGNDLVSCGTRSTLYKGQGDFQLVCQNRLVLSLVSPLITLLIYLNFTNVMVLHAFNPLLQLLVP